MPAVRGGDNYNNRVAVRLAELTALQKASTNLLYADAVQPDNDEFVATPVKKNFLVRTGNDNKPYSVHIRNHDGKPHKTNDQRMDEELLRWMLRNSLVKDGSTIYSKVRLKDGSILGATPNPRTTGPWFD